MPHTSGTTRPGVVRSRSWTPAVGRTAAPALVLSYLLDGLAPRERIPGDRSPLTVEERFELGYESFLRHGGRAPSSAFGRCTPSTREARRLHRLRGENEPATESYLETRTIQRLREFGYRKVFRQLPLLDGGGRLLNRLDIVVPHNPSRSRPAVFTADVGVVIEADGRAYHAETFEKDRRRHNNIVVAGAAVLVVTHNVVEFRPGELRQHLRDVMKNHPNRPPKR